MIYLLILGLYTFGIIYCIHFYEKKIVNYIETIEDYQRALRLSKGSPKNDHYSYLQLENKKLKNEMERLKKSAKYESEQIKYLSDANDHLQNKIKGLCRDKQDLIEGTFGQYKGYSVNGNQDIQYEYSVYQSGLWESAIGSTDLKKQSKDDLDWSKVRRKGLGFVYIDDKNKNA